MDKPISETPEIPGIDQINALEAALGLPPREKVLTTPFSECMYGVQEIVRDYCGLPFMPRLIPGFWCHGWQPDYFHVHPEFLGPMEAGSCPQWFLRQSQADVLTAGGYPDVRAIGHPIIYLPRPEVPRRKRSLLVMPCRTFRNFRRDEGCDYPETIAGIRDQFDEVVVCIASQSLQAGDWLESFQKLGLPIVRGTSYSDRNGYLRVAKLMSQFEFVTTNGIGSQIAYAAYFGAKISVWGPEPVVPPMGKPKLFAKFPHLEQEFHRVSSVPELLLHEPWLGVDPWLAQTAVPWGERELGVQHKLSPEEPAREFRLTPEQMAEFSAEQEAVLAQFYRIHLKQRTQEAELENLGRQHKQEMAVLKKEIAKLHKEVHHLRLQSQSRAWKLVGKRLYSLEKRLKKPNHPNPDVA